MARKKSSKQWLAQHFSDPYVKKAHAENFRSRAVYKLIEIQTKDKLIKPGMVVIDLGAAPGGWSQFLVKQVGRLGKVIALDILTMDPIPGVEFVLGDFKESEIFESLILSLAGKPVDLVISDMAPNLSGMAIIDQPRIIYLAELALELVKKVLRPGGAFLVKCFHGQGFETYLKSLRLSFAEVLVRKPQASRTQSAEVYLLAKGYHLKS